MSRKNFYFDMKDIVLYSVKNPLIKGKIMLDLVSRLRVSAHSLTKFITAIDNGHGVEIDRDAWLQLERLLDEAADELEKAQDPKKLVTPKMRP